MPKMRITVGTQRFSANHEMTTVDLGFQRSRNLLARKKLGQPDPESIFRIRRKQWFTTAATNVSALRLGIRIFTRKRRLGRRLARNLVFVIG